MGCFKKGVQEPLPIVSLTGCKSLFDSVHRVGGPRAPAEKRLIVDLARLPQMIYEEQARWIGTKGFEGGKAMRWLPTAKQMADNLTKIITKNVEWWSRLSHLEPAGSKNTE